MKDNIQVQAILNRFDSGRLTLAREFKGLQKKELAERLNLSPSAITQFETGKVRPNKETLARISLALGIPLEFFKSSKYNLKTIPTDMCHFRSLRSATQIERRKVLSAGTILIELIAFLEQYVEFPQEDVSSVVVNKSINNIEEIENFAVSLRSKWGRGLGPIKNMIDLVENHGVLVFRIPNHSTRLDAFSLWFEGRPCIFLSSEKDSASRIRFDIAHELGHLLMHADISPGNKELERQANAFASAFLLPYESFILECPRKINWSNWEPFYDLKRRWKVSLAALIRRAKDVSCISEAMYHRAYIYLSKNNMRKSEKFEPPMEYPNLIPKAIGLMYSEGWDLGRIAAEIGLNESELRNLVVQET